METKQKVIKDSVPETRPNRSQCQKEATHKVFEPNNKSTNKAILNDSKVNSGTTKSKQNPVTGQSEPINR